MVKLPFELNDPNEAANALLQNGFSAPQPPTGSGFASRQALIPNLRPAVQVRNLIRWLVPESGIVEMFINPQNISWGNKKLITPQRTKGGYVMQYWGEELGTMKLSGTTGSSGVEGINVLYDVYRAEQLAYDPFALALAAQQQQTAEENQSTLGQIIGAFGDLLQDAKNTGVTNVSSPKPTLASYAFGIEMYYSGWVFRGFFNDFNVEESAERLGLFNYNIDFTITQRRGFRSNYLGWHHSATSGPSDSSDNGTPHSYQGLANGFTSPESGFTTSPNLQGTGTAIGTTESFTSLIKL